MAPEFVKAGWRRDYYQSFVGKHSSTVIEEFGNPDDTATIGGEALATYYLPLGNGTSRKVVFAVDSSDTVVRVNYWPK